MPIQFYEFRANLDDDRHCFQATFAMAWEALLGERLSWERAELLTGFVTGQSTWPFAGMLAAADQGLFVANVEDFDVGGFLESPLAELTRQFGGDKTAAEAVAARSSARSQVPVLRKCVDHQNIDFVRSSPTLEFLREALDRDGTICVCNINHRTLVGRPGYNGHFVIVKQIEGDTITLDNPGLPAIADQRVPVQLFERAWAPEPLLANTIVFSRERLPSNA